ncbi:hypothetical protein C8R46DRAFT_1322513 [Mycena filopes]|nr:hypothetical protein C8R46DRAFT_1322513 [Mycena filopes]
MDAFATILTSTIAYLASSPAQQPASAAVEDLPQLDTVNHDRSTGSSGSINALALQMPAAFLHFTRSPVKIVIQWHRLPYHQHHCFPLAPNEMDLRVNSRRADLPPELLDLIIRENAADSPTLQSCALVCSAFLTSSQACIFSLVLLKPQEGTTQRLYDILSRSPHLCAHVRTLHLIDLIEDCETWYPCAVALLYLLNSLKSVVLRGYAGVDWCNFPQELRGAICALCQRSALRALKVFQLGTFRDLAEFG